MVDKKHVTDIEKKVVDLKNNMAQVAGETDQHMDELLKIIHNPGYTTPRDVQFTTGILDAMSAQTKAFAGLKEALMAASRDIIKQG